MSALVPGNYDSPINIDLPVSPQGNPAEDMQMAYNAIQKLLMELTESNARITDLEARLLAAGIP